jgi:hypothetical protein
MQHHEDPGVETLCDFFAAALLLPRSRLEENIRRLEGTSAASGYKPLHVILPLADIFGVTAKVVARRLLFDVWRSHKIVFSMKRVSRIEGGNSRFESIEVNRTPAPWYTMWFASTAAAHGPIPAGWRIPLDGKGRKLPDDLVPNIPFGETSIIRMDGRVFSAAHPKNPNDSRQTIGRLPAEPDVEALATLTRVSVDMFGEGTDIAIIAFS